MHDHLEVTSIHCYYDGPISGEARIGGMHLYYLCVDEVVDPECECKTRIFYSWELRDDEWDVLRHNLELEKGEVRGESWESSFEQVLQLHVALRGRTPVISFREDGLPFPELGGSPPTATQDLR